MSNQHWPDEFRRMAGVASHARPDYLKPVADGETFVETPAFDELESHRGAWRDLARRALEPNPFLEPDFALSAALHMPPAQRPDFVLIWQGAGFERRARLIGLAAIERKAPMLGVARAWRHRHGALTTPLIDQFAGARAVDALLAWLAARKPRQPAVAFDSLVQGGQVYDLLVERCGAKGLAWSPLREYSRAVLVGGEASAETFARARSAKHRREIDRLQRRLAECGSVTSHSATNPAEIRAAAEWFLALEHGGWKGRRGTDFLSDAGDAAFMRTVMRLFAADRRCRIDWLAVEGRPVAMTVLLTAADRAYAWKTAYDESYAHYSPGVQLFRALIQRQAEDASTALTDSCAIADHPMIDRVWPDRQAMVELLIGVDATNAARVPRVVRRERFRRGLRAAVKATANKALGRKVS
ncbi:MAG: GNAT family N-acetyltransferase [Hyphomicrobiales bacterium]|nr:GNAT family N-acetyltransferase [Hyphomicrobiales bacterium]